MGLINMNNKTSVLRPLIEDLWAIDSLNEKKIMLYEIVSDLNIPNKMKKRRLMLDIGNCQSKEKLNDIAKNCWLTYEGHGVIA